MSAGYEDGEICAGSTAVARVYQTSDFPCLEDDEEQEAQAECDANARLIAAAPDMHADLSAAPILSDFNTSRGFDQAKFVAAYQDWMRGMARTLAKVAGQPTLPPLASAAALVLSAPGVALGLYAALVLA